MATDASLKLLNELGGELAEVLIGVLSAASAGGEALEVRNVNGIPPRILRLVKVGMVAKAERVMSPVGKLQDGVDEGEDEENSEVVLKLHLMLTELPRIPLVVSPRGHEGDTACAGALGRGKGHRGGEGEGTGGGLRSLHGDTGNTATGKPP